MSGDVARVKKLLHKTKVDLNLKCYEYGERKDLSALIVASAAGQHEVAKLLLENDALVDLQVASYLRFPNSIGNREFRNAIKRDDISTKDISYSMHHNNTLK